MVTWQEIGQDNFRAAVAFYDGGYYQNAVSRLYADYLLFRIDKFYATKAFRAAEKIFRDLEVTPERKGSS